MTSERPKGYTSDYNLFQMKTLKDVAVEFPELKANDHKRIVAARWKSLSITEKADLKVISNADKTRYIKEVTIYNESHPDDLIVPRINHPDGKEVKPQDRFHSAYNHYVHQEKDFLLALVPLSERKSKIGKYSSYRWKNMEDDEKQLYKDLEAHT